MPGTIHAISVVRICLAVAALCISGCALTGNVAGPGAEENQDIQSVVVMAFEAAPQGRDMGASIRCPICGAVFQGGPIKKGADTYMTHQLTEWMKEKTSYTLIPWGTAQSVRASLLAEEIGMSEHRLLVETGKRLEADAVISGTIYRFRERVGAALSVDTPASVAFGLHLHRVADGRLIWVGRFDETQHSLSEDLFRWRTFLKRGGGWLTAEELASFGFQEVMATFSLN
ncbi:MAG: hypothetical protein SWQ30_00975 [Thermodesulfobacteriota bacterium]|nr:hypothetical protein [Thermodesulfobacteriota bacterium]